MSTTPAKLLVFPARAGMSRPTSTCGTWSMSFPRPRGDEPEHENPHVIEGYLFPAYAEMSPSISRI